MTKKSKGNYINGQWKTTSGRPFESINPATGATIWSGQSSITTEVEAAVVAARHAFEAWASAPIEHRIAILNAFQEVLKAKKDQLSLVISEETGKPRWESATEVDAMVGKVAISIDAYAKRCAEIVKDLALGRSITRHRPHGVVAVLGPFNFPGHLPNGHIVPALLAGNTVVFKPSELTPHTAEVTMECWEQAKIPAGVLNMVQGGHEPGIALAQHPGINGLYFTGSYQTGKILSEHFGKHPEKILALELGGNNPLIVSDVSDHNTAALITIQSAFLTAGQRCTCARRLIVPLGAKGDAFVTTLSKMIGTIRVGSHNQEPQPFMGPVISERMAFALIDAQNSLEQAGGKVLARMHLLKSGTGLVTPALIDVTDVKTRADEELFGPLLQLIRVADYNAALVEANNTRFGLSAGLLSTSKQEYELFANRVRAGVLTWNCQTTGASSAAPFGGIGCSGNHRPSAYYAADYCAYPVAAMENESLKLPPLPPGLPSPQQ